MGDGARPLQNVYLDGNRVAPLTSKNRSTGESWNLPGMSEDNHLEIVDDGHPSVPVFDCHVILSPADADGVIRGRVSTLPEIATSGRNEREILRKLVADFKTAVGGYVNRGEAIPWTASEALQPGESQRWIPVHL